MDWKSMIPGCFGWEDCNFAIHHTDEKHAFELLKKLREADASWKEVEDEVTSFLKKKGCSENHIARQIKSVEQHIRLWLRN